MAWLQWVARMACLVAAGLAATVAAGPPPVVGGPLLAEIVGMPAGQWKQVNRNLYSDAWTPVDLRPLNGLSVSPPSKIILAWSGFGWDTKRGDLILYGGGHANYSGNDVYRFRAQSLSWTRAALPSEIAELYDSNAYLAIDGADAAPSSAHTYDNNLYLPIVDRFLTFGGALYNTGGAYVRPDDSTPGAIRKTGPYFFDPARADSEKVGGTTGSHVRRVAPFPSILGGNMWQNRDLPRNRPLDPQPTKHTSGCTAYSEEGGFDVVYVGATGGSGTNLDLFRYTFRQVATPTSDIVQKVGAFWAGTSGQTACGYDPARKLFVRTGNEIYPFIFWDLNTPGSGNRDVRVEVNASLSGFADWVLANDTLVRRCGLDFDPLDNSFAVWCGGLQVWRLRPPPTNVAAGWIIEPAAVGGPAPPQGSGTGVLGKWKYVPGYDVFIALENVNDGNVWIYKPLGWSAPGAGDDVNFAPQATLAGPASGATFDLGTAITLTANASDGDGSVTRVEFLADGKPIGTAASPPYGMSWTPSAAGTYRFAARAVDDLGGEGLSLETTIVVRAPNVPPSLAITAPTSGVTHTVGASLAIAASASDSDGAVVRVEFFAGTQALGEDSAAPYQIAWTPSQPGTYTLTARATDNVGASTVSGSVVVIVVMPTVPPTLAMTSPAHGSTHSLGAAVTLAATAADSDGTVVRVEFAVNGQWVGEDTSPPYALDWTPSAVGTFALTARAIDNGGASTTSTAVGITVVDDAGGSTVTLRQGVDGYAGTADTMLSVYAPTTTQGNATAINQYGQNYTGLIRFAVFASEGGPVPDGATIVRATLALYKEVYNYTYRLHPLLRRWDEAQATWNQAETGATWVVPGAGSAGGDYGTVHDAEFVAPWEPGWMTFDVTQRLVLASQGAANHGWRIVGVAGYNGLRRIVTSEHAETSLRPQLTVVFVSPTPNNPPTVALTTPVDGTSIALGTGVPLAADAADTDGTVVRVEFFANGQKVGEDATSPYEFTWTPGTTGPFTLFARAIDDRGAYANSATVTVGVTGGTAVVTQVLQQGASGYAGTTDAMLSSYQPALNYGAAPTLILWEQNYANLMRFAIFAREGGPVPDAAQIVSATLELYKEYYSYVYRLHPLLKAWDESQATWDVARTGTAWTMAGARGVDSDYAAAHDAETAAPWDPGWVAFDITTRIQSIGQGGMNHGWRIVPVTGYKATRRFYASEYAVDAALRPKLTIRYSLP